VDVVCDLYISPAHITGIYVWYYPGAMNERNLNEGQWWDRKQWGLGVGQRRKTFWTRYIRVHTLSRGTQIFQKSRSNLKSMGTWEVTWNRVLFPPLWPTNRRHYKKFSRPHDLLLTFETQLVIPSRGPACHLSQRLHPILHKKKQWKLFSRLNISI